MPGSGGARGMRPAAESASWGRGAEFRGVDARRMGISSSSGRMGLACTGLRMCVISAGGGTAGEGSGRKLSYAAAPLKQDDVDVIRTGLFVMFVISTDRHSLSMENHKQRAMI